MLDEADMLGALLRTRAEFGRLLLEAAPLPAGSAKDNRHLELEARYERYMPSAEVEAIALLFYALGACGVAAEAPLRRLFEAHNAHMEELAADPAYLRRVRASKDTFLNARFPRGAIDQAVKNAVYHGRVALDATAVGRLVVEAMNKNQAGEAMDLLASLGFFDKAEGAFAAKLYLSTGRLEAVYRALLAGLTRAVGVASGGGRGDDGDAWIARGPVLARVSAHGAAAAWGLFERVRTAGADELVAGIGPGRTTSVRVTRRSSAP